MQPLPTAKEKYLEAEETLLQQLDKYLNGYEGKFKLKSIKH